MAKKVKKAKITETIVNQLQETPTEEAKEVFPAEEVPVEKPKPVEKKKEGKHHNHPQKSKSLDVKPGLETSDSETAGIGFGIFGVL